jgi:PAS domain S-box-containing protein
LRWIGTNTDIEDQKEAVRALAGLNETLARQVAERTADRDRMWRLSTDIMLVTRFNGIMMATNPAWQAALGWTEGELIGRNVFDLIHPDDIESTSQAADALESGMAVARFDNRLRHRDGSYRWITWAAVPGDGLINAVGRDFTAEREQAEALAAAQEALRQSQKMEAVGQLTGGLAHDFNNLLTGIAGSLELLQARIAQGRLGEIDRYVTAAQGAARRAAALTHRLLAFSRRQTLDPRATDMNRLVADMEELIRRTVGPEIAVEVVAAGGLWTTLVDPNQLENALLNLCLNARDAMPTGGNLTVETANRWLDGMVARNLDLAPGQYVSLCVSDNGAGMTPEVAARAFDPFFTTKPIGSGTGLGLSMIYGFVRQSGGQARIYSEPGRGTMVCLYLPRHRGPAEQPEAPAEFAEALRAGQGESVLIVDDEPTVRMLVTEVLQDLGYTAIEAADGAAGLRVLQSEARVDLLVTDVGLPGGMNGRQLADAGRALRPGLRVLFITGYAENAVISHGHLEHGMHVLTKPFAMEALALRIKDLVSRP